MLEGAAGEAPIELGLPPLANTLTVVAPPSKVMPPVKSLPATEMETDPFPCLISEALPAAEKTVGEDLLPAAPHDQVLKRLEKEPELVTGALEAWVRSDKP